MALGALETEADLLRWLRVRLQNEHGLVAFPQVGGVVTPPQVSPILPWINIVTDFDAVADGSTDNTAAIQAAIDSLDGSGGTILFPRGEYVIAGQLDFNDTGGIQLLGEGAFTVTSGESVSKLIFTGTTDPLVKLGSVEGFQMRNLHAVYTSGSFTGDFFSFDESQFLGGASAIDAHLVVIDGCRIEGDGSTSARSLLRLNRVIYGTVSNSRLRNAQYGVLMRDTAFSNVITVSRCQLLGLDHGVANPGEGCAIMDNGFGTANAAGGGANILIDNTSVGTEIIGNRFGDASAGDGNPRLHVSTNGVFRGAHVSGNDFDAPGASISIVIEGDARGVVFEGNSFGGAGGFDFGTLGTPSGIAIIANDGTGSAVINNWSNVENGVIIGNRSFSGTALESGVYAQGLLRTDLFVEMPEQGSDPGAPAANEARLYAKDDGGVTKPYWRSTSGVERLAFLSDVTGGGFQPLDADLTSIAAVASAADTMLYATAAQTWALTALTSFARTLLDDTDAASARTTLELGSLAVLDDGAGLGVSGGTLRIGASAAGDGLTGGGGVALAVGAGAGIAVNADDVAIGDAELLAVAGLTSAADKGILFTGSGTAALIDLIGAQTDWTTYTPGTTNITLGNGSITGRWCQVGKLIVFEATLTRGSTTTFSAQPRIGSPVTMDTTLGDRTVGECRMFDTSAGATYFGHMVQVSSTRVGAAALNASATYLTSTDASATVPMTWATGDTLRIQCVVEAA